MKRFYLNNFKDVFRQGAIEALMCKDISTYVEEQSDKVCIWKLNLLKHSCIDLIMLIGRDVRGASGECPSLDRLVRVRIGF